MSDPTPLSATDATGTADAPSAGPPSPVTAPWWKRRRSLLISVATLLAGCVLGAGAVAVGRFVAGDGQRGGDRTHSNRDQRGAEAGNPGRDGGPGRSGYDGRPGRSGGGDKRQPAPAASATPSTPAPSKPAPSATAVTPSPTAS